MKLRDILSHYNPTTGRLPYGNYYVEGVLKMAELKEITNENNKKYISAFLSSNYNSGDTVSIKRNVSIIVFYEKLGKDTNSLLIKAYFHLITPTQQAEFLSKHSANLATIFKEDFEKYFLELIFYSGKLPSRFEVYYNNEKITSLKEYKNEWRSNPGSFKLMSYSSKILL